MIFKDLVDSYSWKDIEYRFKELYPDQEGNFEGYEKVLSRLKEIEPVDYNMEIKVELVKHSLIKNDPDFVPYWNVSGDDGSEGSWALEFNPWNEWLGMTVAPKTSSMDFLIHCLWEMTFCGFEEEEIQGKLDNLNKAAKEVGNDDRNG